MAKICNIDMQSTRNNFRILPKTMNEPMNTHKIKSPQIVVEPPQQIPPKSTEMPILAENIQKPQNTPQEVKDALEAKKLAEEAILKAEEELEKEDVPPEPPVKKQKKIFKCKKCGKELKDKKKLQRHIGMAHYQDLEI